MQKIQKIWLDCDPGHDDMLAIILAALSSDCQLIGISTSAGNSTIQNTTKNALNILEEINRRDIVVVRGSPNPLCRKLQTAPDIHGESGLQGAHLKESEKKAIIQNPFYEIYVRLIGQEEGVNFVVTGAMTNLAILLKSFPSINKKIKAITIMGGAIGLGNWSPAAEFNIVVDPEAASIVFKSGIPINMVPLEVTHTVLIDDIIFKALGEMESEFSTKLISLFRYFQKQYKDNQNFDYPVAHDPCAVHFVLKPTDFTGRLAEVDIELEGASKGRTNCKFKTSNPNAFVCEKINITHFWHAMLKCISKIK